MNETKPKIFIIAGANGTGKTTLANSLCVGGRYRYIGADAIAQTLSPENLDRVRVSAGKRFFEEIRTAAAAKENLVLETTLSGLGFKKHLRWLQDQGYERSLVMIFLESPESCVARVQERVRKGGHSVPESDVRRRFYRAHHNFWNTYRYEVDKWYLFYNASENMKEVAFGEGEMVSIVDEDLLDLFLSKNQ